MLQFMGFQRGGHDLATEQQHGYVILSKDVPCPFPSCFKDTNKPQVNGRRLGKNQQLVKIYQAQLVSNFSL